MMSKLELEKTKTAYEIQLNDPPLNILDLAMLAELRNALRHVKNDRPLLIISAAGEKAFSAGASVQDHMGDRIEQMLSTFHECFRLLSRLDLVSVALVRGAALGGGCELALAADFVLASSKAKFGQPEIALGVFPPVAAYQLSRQVAPRRGLELLLTGDPVDAATAREMGMVNSVFEPDSFEEDSKRWMERILRHSASSLRLAKKAFRLASAGDFSDRLARVEELYLGELMGTFDANEGLSAFLEKRKPSWKGE